MAPTIQNGTNSSGADKRPQRPTADRKSDLINRVKYCNNLPDIPFDLKFITYPFENDRFIQYNPTSLERNYRYEVLTEHDLGVTIDLINRDLYQSDPYAQLEAADEKLLEEDVHTPQDSLRSKHHAKSVSWLRRSEYISTEQTRFQPQTMEKVEAKVGFNVKKSFVEETLYMDRESQVKAIQKTFEESKAELKNHYSKPNVTAVEVLQIFPDFVNWKYPCAQVIFDSDPAEAGKNVPAQIEEMSQAMIRGVMDESGEQFVAYFLPTEDTLQKRRRDATNNIIYEDDEEYEYKMAREYNWNVKSKASKGYEENYFLVLRPDGVFYDELETRVRLNKRRQKIGAQPTNTKLVVKHLPLNASEHRMQRYRERQLEAPGEEEEMEESEEEEEELVVAEADSQAQQNTEKVNNDTVDKNNKDDDRSRSNSRSRSRSQSRKRSASRSQSRKRSTSRSSSDGSPQTTRSKSVRSTRSARSLRSRSTRHGSKSISRSRSRSAGSKGTSRSRSNSGSRSRSRSRSKSGSGSGSDGGSRSRSHSREARSASRGTQRSRVSSRRSNSAARSNSGSRSGSGSRSRSVSKSPSRSRSQSVASKSPSVEKDPLRSASGSPAGSQSGSGSESGSDEE